MRFVQNLDFALKYKALRPKERRISDTLADTTRHPDGELAAMCTGPSGDPEFSKTEIGL